MKTATKKGKSRAQGSGGIDYGSGTHPDGFSFHQVVRVNLSSNRIYDPSYGSLTVKTDARSVELKYEDENITHFWNGTSWVANIMDDPLQLIFVP